MEVGSKLDKVLGSGAEGTVYYVDGFAVKIFHKLDLNKQIGRASCSERVLRLV